MLALDLSHPSCVMFRVELKSCEESTILLGNHFSSILCRAFPKDTEIRGWSVSDFHYKNLQDNRYLNGLLVFFGTKLFQYKFIE